MSIVLIIRGDARRVVNQGFQNLKVGSRLALETSTISAGFYIERTCVYDGLELHED